MGEVEESALAAPRRSVVDQVPAGSVSISALTDDDPDEPRTAVQYAIRTPLGGPYAYGDQSWVASGQAIRDGSLPDGSCVVHRTITFTYGEWADPTTDLLARARTYLVQCGGCDAGLLTACTCPQGDPRSVIADLVAEVERLTGGAS